MKSFAILCFLFLASACILAARAEEEEKELVDAPTNDEAPEEPEQTEDEAANDEEENDEETENDEEKDEEQDDEKRSACSKYRYGKLWCTRCCHAVCKPRYCTRRVCKSYACGKIPICHYITKYRLVKKHIKVNVGDVYYPKYITKVIVNKVPYKYKVCKYRVKYCTKCHTITYKCGSSCKNICIKKKCYLPYY